MQYKVIKYMLILSPHEELKSKIIQIKQEFKEKYQSDLMITKPHIALVKFFTWEIMEERIRQKLTSIAVEVAPFKVDLYNYGSFPTHTIYINVATKNAIQNLIKAIRNAQRLMKSPDNNPHFLIEPYIPIARKLSDGQYEKSWLEYSCSHFSGSFMANDMLLLKQKEEKMKYELVQSFAFKNLAVIKKQSSLFS